MPQPCSSKIFHDIQQGWGMYKNDPNCQVLAKLQQFVYIDSLMAVQNGCVFQRKGAIWVYPVLCKWQHGLLGLDACLFKVY